MLALLLAASAARCAVPEYCPSDEALKAAVQSSDDSALLAMIEEANEANPGSFTMMQRERIRRISNVYCGELHPDPPGSIGCRLTVHYSSSRSYQVVHLVRNPDGWTIEQQLAVSRPDRRRR